MSDPNKHHELIIVRRHEDEEHEAHSSAWKVAHADFMTAMMAFFLIMWLINVTDEEVRKGISAYFNPVHLAQGQSEMKGLNKPNTTDEDTGAEAGHSDEASPAGGSANAASAEPSEDHPESPPPAKADAHESDHAEEPEKSAAGEEEAKATAEEGKESAGKTEAEADSAHAEEGKQAGGGDAATAAGDRERAAFQDPYAVLSNLAAQFTADHPTNADAIVGDERMVGLATGDADRDPFDPIYWQMSKGPPARTDQAGDPRKAPTVPNEGKPDAAAAKTVAGDASEAAPSAEPLAEPPPAASVAVEKAPPPKIKDPIIAAAKREEQAAALKTELEESLGALMSGEAPTINVKATPEGILIDLTDDIDFSMFEIGSAIPNPKLVVLMEGIARAVGARNGAVVVRGHTDGRPFRSDLYDNWRLSAARAHMAYYMLVRGGLAEGRVQRIEGYADRALKNGADPYAAENRRIDILIAEGGG